MSARSRRSGIAETLSPWFGCQVTVCYLTEEARLIRRIWQAAPSLSLAHDVGVRGVQAAIAEMAAWSGLPAEVEHPGDDVRFVIACSPSLVPEFAEQIGTVA